MRHKLRGLTTISPFIDHRLNAGSLDRSHVVTERLEQRKKATRNYRDELKMENHTLRNKIYKLSITTHSHIDKVCVRAVNQLHAQ